MGLFDILTNGTLTSVLNEFANQAKTSTSQFARKAPGGLGGLLGAGTLGAVLGNVMSGDIVKNVALAGAGAVAWNFFQKWQQNMQKTEDRQEPAHAAALPTNSGALDPAAMLVMRTMIYAAKADGTIDPAERQRMDAIIKNMLPNQNVEELITKISSEPINPEKIAASVQNPDQAADVYRLSCAVIDIDHFMERGYLGALAKALGISENKAAEIESEATQAKRQLMASVNQSA